MTNRTSCRRCAGCSARPATACCAESGALGLEMLEKETVDLVISDMRMPEMNGAQFLAQVRRRWPDTLRLLLTGYSDIQSIRTPSIAARSTATSPSRGKTATCCWWCAMRWSGASWSRKNSASKR
jgi:DNA-binding NarL/FixJ family response regulator